MRAQNRNARAIQIFFPRLLVELLERLLPIPPTRNIISLGLLVGGQQGRDDLLSSFRPHFTKAERQDKFTITSGEIDFASQRDVAVFGAVILPIHLEMFFEVLPAIRYADKSDRTFQPWRGAAERKGGRGALREEHVRSLVVSYPTGIAIAGVGQMRRQQRIQPIIAELSLERHETDFLQNYVSPGIG